MILLQGAPQFVHIRDLWLEHSVWRLSSYHHLRVCTQLNLKRSNNTNCGLKTQLSSALTAIPFIDKRKLTVPKSKKQIKKYTDLLLFFSFLQRCCRDSGQCYCWANTSSSRTLTQGLINYYPFSGRRFTNYKPRLKCNLATGQTAAKFSSKTYTT